MRELIVLGVPFSYGAVVEMTAVKKPGTPIEYRHYVRERDRENEERK